MFRPFKPDDNDPMKVRRNFALGAFVVICVMVFQILRLVEGGTADTAANLNAASGILIVIFPTLMAPIAHYFYLSGEREKAARPPAQP